jgi:hypothetical protein
MSRPLTSDLLRERTSRLFDRVIAEHGAAEGIVFEKVRCDRCGTIQNLLLGPPVGWTTDGDFDQGFTDLCRGCSQ